VAIFVTDAPAKHAPTMCSLSKSDKSHIFQILSHWLPLNTITNALTQALQSKNKWKNIQCCQLKFFQCSQHKLILFLNFLVFPLFCPPPVHKYQE
jgi:hypothetical protein